MARSSHFSYTRTEEEIKVDRHLLSDAGCISFKLLVCLHNGKDTIHKIVVKITEKEGVCKIYS